LTTVLPSEEAKTLGDVACTERSKTGHEAGLLGGEGTFGYSKSSMFTFDEADVFFYAYFNADSRGVPSDHRQDSARGVMFYPLNKEGQSVQIR
jgi:hypothetical protein